MSKETEQIVTAVEVAARMITSELQLLRRSISKQFEHHDHDLRAVIEQVDGRVEAFITTVKPIAKFFTRDEDIQGTEEKDGKPESAKAAQPRSVQASTESGGGESVGSLPNSFDYPDFTGFTACSCCADCPDCACTEHSRGKTKRDPYLPGSDT